MKELLNYKNITQITEEYIFTKNEGECVRFPLSREHLEEAYNVFRLEFEFYNRMLDELCTEQKVLAEEKDTLLRRLERLEQQKEKQADDPLVRRGLGTLCWEIDVVERTLRELAQKSDGIATVQNKVIEKTMRYLRLRREAEAVYKKVKWKLRS